MHWQENTHSPPMPKYTSHVIAIATMAAASAASMADTYQAVAGTVTGVANAQASANYSQTAVADSFGFAGISQAVGGLQGWHGFTGQLYDAAGIALHGDTALAELGNGQLDADVVHTDATLLPIDRAAVAWQVTSGPASVAATGAVTAQATYATTTASVQGTWSGFTATILIDIAEVIPDNFGIFAGDGLSDAWQVAYFGETNPQGAATADPDGDGQSNREEFAALTLPDNGASMFRSAFDPGAPAASRRMLFSPYGPDSNEYTLWTSTDMITWTRDFGALFETAAAGGQVTPSITSGTIRFYRILTTNND